MLIRQQDPQVQRIIAKVLHKKHNKLQSNSTTLLPPYQKNYILQTENQQLRAGLKELKRKIEKVTKQKQKYEKQQKQIQELRIQFQQLSKQNSSLSQQISRIRAGTLRYKQSDSLNKSNKSVELCCCERRKTKHHKHQNSNSNYSKFYQIRTKRNIQQQTPQQSVQELVLNQPKQKSIEIQCQHYEFYNQCSERQAKLDSAQMNLQSLENIIKEQQKIILEYQTKIAQNRKDNHVGQLVKTTKRVNKTVSVANLHSCDSVGTIVKVLRER